MPKAEEKQEPVQTQIIIPKLDLGMARYTILSLTPILLHGVGEWIDTKKTGGVESKKKVIPSPELQFRRSIEAYLAPKSTKAKPRIQVPGVWFKMMLVNVAGRHTQSIKLNTAGGVFHVMEDYVTLKHSPVKVRKDFAKIPPRTGGLVAIYRGQIDTWSCSFTVRFNRGFIDETGLATLVQTGGFANGLGDWRPQKDGTFGQFEIAPSNASRKKAPARKKTTKRRKAA